MYVEEGQDWIPKSVRAWIYRTLTVVCAFNTIFGVISSGLMSKILAAASMLGAADFAALKALLALLMALLLGWLPPRRD